MSNSSFATDTFEPYVSPEVAAKYLGISRRELLAHTRSGRFVGHAVDPNARRKDWRFKISAGCYDSRGLGPPVLFPLPECLGP